MCSYTILTDYLLEHIEDFKLIVQNYVLSISLCYQDAENAQRTNPSEKPTMYEKYNFRSLTLQKDATELYSF